MNLAFLGAAGTVTGSKTFVTHEAGQLLGDCGPLQGCKKRRSMNWEPFLFDLKPLDADARQIVRWLATAPQDPRWPCTRSGRRSARPKRAPGRLNRMCSALSPPVCCVAAKNIKIQVLPHRKTIAQRR